jgi:hypothetical protein
VGDGPNRTVVETVVEAFMGCALLRRRKGWSAPHGVLQPLVV